MVLCWVRMVTNHGWPHAGYYNDNTVSHSYMYAVSDQLAARRFVATLLAIAELQLSAPLSLFLYHQVISLPTGAAPG